MSVPVLYRISVQYLIAMAFIGIAKDAYRIEHSSFDILGTLIMTAGAILLVYAPTQGPEDVWGRLCDIEAVGFAN